MAFVPRQVAAVHAHESQDLRGVRATALLLIRDSLGATRSRPSFYRKGSMEPSRQLRQQFKT
jgi:hypothetical protein